MSATPSTILVVEDDAIVRMLIVDVLEELELTCLKPMAASAQWRFLKTKASALT